MPRTTHRHIMTAAFLLCFAALAWADPLELSFTVTGDGPRSEEDWMLLQQQIDTDNTDGVTAFLVHVGDIWKGSERLPESHYLQVAALLRTSVAPVYIVPGDNEWTDLLDPAEGWTFWTRHLLRLDRHWEKDVVVERQPGHEENIAWVQNGVLLIGANIVGGDVKNPEEWHARHVYTAEWVAGKLAEHGGQVRAAVLFAQAKPKPQHEDFFQPVFEAAAAFGKPFLYLHGDGHKYELEQPWHAPNLTRVQVDQVAKARPLLVTVTTNLENPFTFNRRLPE